MAIANITKGQGFGGLLTYLLDSDKKPRIISGCMFNSTPHQIAREFLEVANLRPRVTKPVRHFSIAFAPEDGRVDDVVKEAIAFRVLDGMGYEDCQFIAIDHHRDDPGHEEIHDHDHIHIVTNAVTVLGKYVKDSFEKYKIQEILRVAEQDFGLREVKSSWEIKKEKSEAVVLDSNVARIVKDSLKDRPDLQTWLDRLTESDVDVRFNLSKSDNVMGVTFIEGSEVHKGSDIGVNWSVVEQQVTTDVSDLALMKIANLKSQERPVRLNKIERAMFDRSVEMAVMKLGGCRQFKNSRTDMKLDGDTLTVVRMRPHRLMLQATRTNNGEWEPVGFPHIEKKDVEQLERFNGTDLKTFEPEAEDLGETTRYHPDYLAELELRNDEQNEFELAY